MKNILTILFWILLFWLSFLISINNNWLLTWIFVLEINSWGLLFWPIIFFYWIYSLIINYIKKEKSIFINNIIRNILVIIYIIFINVLIIIIKNDQASIVEYFLLFVIIWFSTLTWLILDIKNKYKSYKTISK